MAEQETPAGARPTEWTLKELLALGRPEAGPTQEQLEAMVELGRGWKTPSKWHFHIRWKIIVFGW